MPPCHHWSWSSMKVASDHFTTRQAERVRPGHEPSVTSNSEARWESLLMPTSSAVDAGTIRTLSAAPDVEHDAPARPALGQLEGPLVDAGRVQPRDRPAAGPGTASGRSCSGAGRTCPASSSSRGPRCRASPGRRLRRRAGGELEPPRAVEDPGGRGAARCASAVGRRPVSSGLVHAWVTRQIVARTAVRDARKGAAAASRGTSRGGNPTQPTTAASSARTAAKPEDRGRPDVRVQQAADEVRDDRGDPEGRGLEEGLAGGLELGRQQARDRQDGRPPGSRRRPRR